MDAVYGGSMRYVLTLATALAACLALSAPADASRFVRYGLQDDAWIAYGPGTLDERLDKLDRMGVKLVRYTLNWHEIEARRGRPDWACPRPLADAGRRAVPPDRSQGRPRRGIPRDGRPGQDAR